VRKKFSAKTGAVLARATAVVATAALVLLGVWITGGLVTDDFEASVALTTAFFVVFGAAALALVRYRRAIGVPVLVTLAVVGAAVGGFLAYTSFVDETVNEAVASGERVGEGEFRSHAHETTGTARLVRTEAGLKLQLIDLATDPGPDLKVYLVAGGYRGGDVGDHVDLGGLKGNKGTQEYDVPAGTAVERYSTVVIWCRAFSVAFGAADLA
jgi:electron transfer DM13